MQSQQSKKSILKIKFAYLGIFAYLCKNIVTLEDYERGFIWRYSPL